ncbi:16S rRNA (uracil1498-N3)-methyltransferase [Corynebacterium appendicis CIP 107643]|uniref:Ribosomal RNA small subunit methyltransferase E n=1 Tax=Corynebacterium appendicis CIP 107643 TaxID=1161099 RepID=A0A1N7JLI5_9CORY|nr:16S rRNA (uracil(1498)-N(3))-methyltransferase [Corynebacterium appendicis]WJY61610.1 Ribosomal RNA small subunit methyltransferase E [Corynebacterium appendicis CIP 107643]SIS50121.1 16S rRNA (uracil1498-N3)-methyltransferase [Corynebacterium appendicis CIP 107643]
MSLPYFIADDPASGRLDGAEGRHAVTVKRITAGERIALIDGRGTVAEVEVTGTSGKDRLFGTVVELKNVSQPRPEVIVVQAIPKSERAELAVDLATQGGADAILPWISHRTIARWQGPKVAKNVEKWQLTAREAAKQSRRAWIPEVHDPVTTNQLAEMIQGETALVLHEDAEKKIGEVDLDVDKLFLIVGPEGGIGEDELELLGAVKVKLGPEVLRTASAAFAGLSAIGVLSRW